MDFLTAIKTCLVKYSEFTGRAARSEYWYWTLFYVIGDIVAKIVDAGVFHVPPGDQALHPAGAVYALALFIPSLAVAARRLHDVNRSGWWILIGFTIIGLFFPLLYWNCTKGTDGDNRFGPDPLAGAAQPKA